MLPEFDIRPGIATLPASPIVEIANYGRSLGRGDLIPLWFGEGDVPTPAPIVEAGVKGLRDGRVFYTVQRGLPELRDALSGYLGRVHGVSVPVERITVTGSGMQAIMVAAQMLVGPGDEMAVVSPVWPNISAAVGVAGGTAVQVPMTLGDQGWTLDLERLFAACGPRTKAIFVNSPGNPTGWVMEKADMARLMAFARARGLWVVSDEVYARLVYDRPVAPSFLEVSEPDDRLIVINSFSKNWSMTGWRLGWMVTPARLGPVLENLIQFSNSGVAEFVQMAGLTAIEQGEPFVAELVERCRAARDQVMAVLGNLPRVRVQPPPGAFYAFFQVEGEPDSMALARRIIDEAGVGLAPGTAFGAGGDGALRLCFASRLESLKTALARMAPVLS